MPTATRTPVRIPSIEPAAMSGVRRVVTAKTSGRVQRRVVWFTGAVTTTSLLAACSSSPSQPAPATMTSPPGGLSERRPEEHGKQGAGGWFST